MFHKIGEFIAENTWFKEAVMHNAVTVPIILTFARAATSGRIIEQLLV